MGDGRAAVAQLDDATQERLAGVFKRAAPIRNRWRCAAGSGQPAVSGEPTERALGRRLHLCGDLGGLRLRCVRDRRVRATHHRLACSALNVPNWSWMLWNKAIWARSGANDVVHHSEHGSQYLLIRYSERLAEIGAQGISSTSRIWRRVDLVDEDAVLVGIANGSLEAPNRSVKFSGGAAQALPGIGPRPRRRQHRGWDRPCL
jgi:hypothetical protein